MAFAPLFRATVTVAPLLQVRFTVLAVLVTAAPAAIAAPLRVTVAEPNVQAATTVAETVIWAEAARGSARASSAACAQDAEFLQVAPK